jgi:hypothetical protein
MYYLHRISLLHYAARLFGSSPQPIAPVVVAHPAQYTLIMRNAELTQNDFSIHADGL